MCGRQGILQERMRNRSCVGCELILDFLFNWISLFFFMYLQSILGLFGDMSYLSFVNFCFFAFAVDDNFECCLEQDQPHNAWIK